MHCTCWIYEENWSYSCTWLSVILLHLQRTHDCTDPSPQSQKNGMFPLETSWWPVWQTREQALQHPRPSTSPHVGGFIECARTINKLFFLPNLLIISAWIILTFLILYIWILIILGLDLFIGLCMWICVGIILHLQGCEMNWLWMMFFEFNLNNWEIFFSPLTFFFNSIYQKIYFVNYWILKSFAVKGSIKKNKSITKLIIYIQWFFHQNKQ